MPEITLLTTKGKIHNSGGLNWGANPNNHTRKLDSYIPIHINTIRVNPGLFNPKEAHQNVITLHWDDGTKMHGLFEGNIFDRISGNTFPKQISSHPNKDILGKYFRKRLGLTNETKVTLQDLINYGRTTVTIDKIDNLNYSLDFHI